MPFSRPTLSQLQTQVAGDIQSSLPGTDPLLQFSNLGIMGSVQAMLAYLHYGYLDWIAQQSVPFTATDEYLEAWAALKGVTREAATQATGSVTFTGTNGTVLNAGATVVRGDGTQYLTTSSGIVASGTVTVTAQAVSDPTGLTGAFGNCAAATVMTLGSVVPGITSSGVAATAFTGGADLESDTSLRSRMLLAYQNPPHGGDASDYVNWALAVPGVTRAWCVPHGYGAGTVLVFVMLDASESAYGGFPQGVSGCATDETRATVATGDQLAVANAIYPQQPVTALVYVMAPTPNPVAFTITGLSGAGTTVQSAVEAAIADVFLEYGTINAGSNTVYLGVIDAAIAAVPGAAGFTVTVPSSNIVSPAGSLPTLGTVTFA